jgi:hypothetical protein
MTASIVAPVQAYIARLREMSDEEFAAEVYALACADEAEGAGAPLSVERRMTLARVEHARREHRRVDK